MSAAMPTMSAVGHRVGGDGKRRRYRGDVSEFPQHFCFLRQLRFLIVQCA
jgi:hypothetical protein